LIGVMTTGNDAMPRPASRWLLITFASALAVGASACHKDQTATDPKIVSVPATKAERINAMSIEAPPSNGDAGTTAPAH
jgi:hypothetical protein